MTTETLPAQGPVDVNVRPHDMRRWRMEDGDVALRELPFAYFSDQNGYTMDERCRIGNLGIGHMTRVGMKAVFRVA